MRSPVQIFIRMGSQTRSRSKLTGVISILFLLGPVVAIGGLSAWSSYESSFAASFPSAEPPCIGFAWPAVQEINHTSSLQPGSPGFVTNPQLPLLSYQKNMTLQVATASPVTIATGPGGTAFGLFFTGGDYYLANSRDFVNWVQLGTGVVPKGYLVTPGEDLGVTREAVIFVSATRLVNHLNSTIFRASYDAGATFQTVLNVSLRAKLENHTRINTGPGTGFWHGVQETGNGYIFAGIYNPQGLIYRSTDNGHSWELVYNASRGSDWHNEIHDLEVSPNGDFIYATTDDESGTDFNQSLLLSTDYGNSWNTLFNAMAGGAGLPPHLTPTTIGFLNNGGTVILGFEGWYKSQVSRATYILDSNSHGCLAARHRVSASNTGVDPFISWWMSPKNATAMFVLTHESDPTPDHGVGLFTLTASGGLDMIMSLKGEDTTSWYSTSFLQIAGPVENGDYAILVLTGDQTNLVVAKL